MGSTYTQILYHIVFCTKYRRKIMLRENRKALYAYMAGIIKNRNCRVRIINGFDDHIHILTHLHPSERLSDLVRDIKVGSHQYIREAGLFPEFIGWQTGYAAFTCSNRGLRYLTRYIANQEFHHLKLGSAEELRSLLKENGVDYDETYFE